MKKKMCFLIIIVMLLAIIFARETYRDYQDSFEENVNFYYIQQGVYIDDKNIQELEVSSITVFEENKYYIYLGMTTKEEIAKKIKEMYEKEGMTIYIKEGYTNNQEFLSELSQYDVLLESTNNQEEIENILETILSTFQETMKVE